MPKYFFHVRDHDALIADQEGIELSGPEAVLEECRRIVREVLDEEQWRDDLTAGRRFEIVDELGRVVVTVPFRAD